MIAVIALVMLLVGFGAAFVLNPAHTKTTTYPTTYVLTYTTTITISPSQGSAYELNCVVTFHGDNPYATVTTVNGTTVTTLLASSYTSLLKDYTTTTSVSSEPGEAVSTATFLPSAQGFPLWNETVCTWLPR